MNTQLESNNKGFTIIEVVLVLAIAGLIFLMVFIALPALQRSQRDTQRREDISRFVSQINSYQTNNNGSVPSIATSSTSFLNSYMKQSDGEFKDPKTGENYTIVNSTDAEKVLSDGQIQYAQKAKCDGEKVATSGASSRSVAVKIKLEGSGYFCKDNQ
ncbi:MAG: type II secretion system GspH family protein [bacterium]|nr:type II secretion system GspH family protein [bacterium]